MKKCYNSLRITEEWCWKGWELLSKIFLVAWMESIMTMILETTSLEQAWLMLHLMAKSSASVLVTNNAWWTVLVSGWFAMCMCDIDAVILFLMLASVMTRAVWGDEELWRTMVSSSWAQILFFSLSFLVAKLKERQSEKISMMYKPGTNFWLRGEKEGKMPYDLLQESIRWPLIMFFWWLVNEPIECGFGAYYSFIR